MFHLKIKILNQNENRLQLYNNQNRIHADPGPIPKKVVESSTRIWITASSHHPLFSPSPHLPKCPIALLQNILSNGVIFATSSPNVHSSPLDSQSCLSVSTGSSVSKLPNIVRSVFFFLCQYHQQQQQHPPSSLPTSRQFYFTPTLGSCVFQSMAITQHEDLFPLHL